MQLIKLDAIDSTNDFLKAMAANSDTSNFTVVTAENQTKGKGQMGAVWNSEIGKNLIMSILIKKVLSNITDVFDLNIVVALSVIDVLKKQEIPDLSIKWPNDIMSANKKIGGILIENSIKSDGSIYSVAGLGLNVNQTNFENLPKASSLAVVTDKNFDKGNLLIDIVASMKMNIEKLKENKTALWQEYESELFRKEMPTVFENQNAGRFMGIIKGVSKSGRLQVLMENDQLKDFEIKQIQMLY
ncbi:biotin--[acetyl-CoA-carboxylase] ligase [Flavobacterium noncentrifugens]|uniref:BirA family transcriptional regulator, biotin operon repressor / biotin-[acetyl-CoA-carboxylase] ligase n=1 Tax=Flavobacterium noncentrifugens TaxID=1128970 RepID=A0A1G9BM50_9FLAO|nr:biotin--[acetyl-CoA-carboxylase] ligase [Flavobacterium noncentrifugens]GEP52486.1 biotin--[acetyl-CoA-carboxylase] ligase [Flavobacterium noncentrifugens]SDK39935.1 BirA family transcriptional regulator, biotin operon repressor / biotin-[acetyl-CoA-carboxylase] ligase [Flavobacterium noncentrifugens]